MKVRNILLVIFLAIFSVGNGCVGCGDYKKQKEIREEISKHIELYKKIIDFIKSKQEIVITINNNTEFDNEVIECLKNIENNKSKQNSIAEKFNNLQHRSESNPKDTLKAAYKELKNAIQQNQNASSVIQMQHSELIDAFNKAGNYEQINITDAEKLSQEIYGNKDAAGNLKQNINQHKRLQKVKESIYGNYITECNKIIELIERFLQYKMKYIDGAQISNGDIVNGGEWHHIVPLNSGGMSVKSNLVNVSSSRHKHIHRSCIHKHIFKNDLTYLYYKDTGITKIDCKHTALDKTITTTGNQQMIEKHNNLIAAQKVNLQDNKICFILQDCNNLNEQCTLCYLTIHKNPFIFQKLRENIQDKLINYQQENVISQEQQYDSHILDLNQESTNIINNIIGNTTTNYTRTCNIQAQVLHSYKLEYSIILYTEIHCTHHRCCHIEVWTEINTQIY